MSRTTKNWRMPSNDTSSYGKLGWTWNQFFSATGGCGFRKSIAALIFLELGETQPKSEKNIIVLYYCNYIAIFLSQLLFKLYSYISYNYCYKIILVVQLVIAESMVCGLWLRFCSECSRSLARTGISPDLSTKVGQGIQWSGSNIMAWPGRSMECSAYW